ARRRQQVFLRDWQNKLDQFLQFNDREVLQGAGKISKKMAAEKAQAEYVQFADQQRRLPDAEGETDIAGLLQCNRE
ncbi:RhuM family protein, partial [Escherichia coli]